MSLVLPAPVITQPATVYASAVRVDPPPPQPPLVFASDCDEMHYYRIQAGLPAIFDRLGWRESNCRNEDRVKTFCCYGYWQLFVSLHLRDARLEPGYTACGIDSYLDVNSDTEADKARQACAAKVVYDVMGLGPWS